LQHCENPFEKPQKTQKDKVGTILQTYVFMRATFGRYFMGDPFCGGDPIGNSLGLNNDIPKPILLEIGKNYEYEGNVNLAKTDRNYSGNNIFQTSNINNKNTEIKITLTADCSGQGTDGFYFNVGICNANAFQYTSSTSNCVAGFSVLNTEKKVRKFKDDYQICTVSNSITSFFILVIENNCKYKIELRGV
jgi:hypothetical protein